MKSDFIRFSLLTAFIFTYQSVMLSQSVKDCEAALVQNTELETLQLSERLLAYSILSKDQYEEKNRKGEINIPGYFTGNWKDFSTSINSIFQSSGSISSLDASRNYSKYYLSVNSTKAYLGCLETIAKQSYGFNYYLQSVSEENIVLFFRWRPTEQPNQKAQPTLKIQLAVSGAIDPTNGKELEILPNSEKPFIFKRNKGEEFILVATPSFGQAATITIPARIKFKTVKDPGPTFKQTYTAYCSHGGNECAGGGTMENKKCPIELRPPTGYVFEQNPKWYNLTIKDYGGNVQQGTNAELVSSSPSKIVLNVGCRPSTKKGAKAEGTIEVGTYRYVIKEVN